MSQEIKTLITPENLDQAVRFDKFLSESLPDFSRSYIKKNIKEGNVFIDSIAIDKPSQLLTPGSKIEFHVPKVKDAEIVPEEETAKLLDIVYEDNDIIIINKQKNMVVHPAPGHFTGTIVNGIMYHCHDNLSAINGELRPGIVHRIDKDTTGLIVICKNDKAHADLSRQFQEHTITRKYHAIVYNNLLEDSGVIDKPLSRHPVDRKKIAICPDGRRAVTHYQVLNHLNKQFNYIECQLETGRTHQIRVHMSSIGHPLLGDTIYGPSNPPKQFKNLIGQTLHAKTIGFVHPTTKEYMEWDSPLPDYFQKLLNMLKNN